MCAALLLTIFLSACQNGPAINGGCEWAKPIYVSRSDVLTDETKRDILSHNETWKAVCKK
jgi:hypothetical protein